MSKDKKENVEAIYPLSPMQEGMLFHSLSDHDSTAYFEQYTCTFKGKLSAESYKRAWQRVVDHNPILRTLVIWDRKDKPLQVVRKKVTLDWIEEDWRDIPKDQHTLKLNTFLLECRQRGFNLKKAPLMNMALIHVADDEFIFIWNFHHLLLDGWSGPLLFNQLFKLYKAFSLGKDIILKTTPPYRNYIAWLQKQDISLVEKYWKKVLEGFTEPTVINTKNSSFLRNEIPSYEKLSINLSENSTRALELLAREHQITLNTIIQGAWSILLGKYSGEDDVVFGSIVSGRPADLDGVEEIVGLFINVLPVRIKINYKETVFGWLKKIQLQQLESREFEYSPLVEVQKWSDIPRGQALFESIVVFENFPSVDDEGNALGFTIENELTREETNYPLTIGVEVSEKMLLNCIYDVSSYESKSIESMLIYLKRILENIIDEPTQKLSSISLLSEEDKEHPLSTNVDAWNTTKVTRKQVKALHLLFEAQVVCTPDSIAITYEDESWTYNELNLRANQLAHYLCSVGVGPDVLVAVSMERSLEMSMALMAILKAGGAYVPFDPSFPKERLSFMLEDTQVSIILTQSHLKEQLPDSEARSLCLDVDCNIWDSLPTTNVEITEKFTSDNLFNVIFTSGSTGKPKGVMVPHAGIINRLLWMQDNYPLDASDSVLQKTPYSFDVSVWELFWPLIVGARLVFAKSDGHRLPDYLRDIIQEQGITTLHFVPSMLGIFLQTENIEQCRSVRRVFCSGEALKLEHERVFFERLDHAELHNLYGPTEASIDVSYFQCHADSRYRSIPIGKAVDNTQLHVLDVNLQPLAVGMIGELYIGGVQLARGYLNREELTNTTFIKNPFYEKGHPSKRLYKTGDLVRYLTDGNIEYIGRIDFQVKLRGLRIELGEIEACLNELEEVKVATVIMREDEPGEKQLVAYLVAHNDILPSTVEIRDFLKEKLPAYMIPIYYIWLDELPLTGSGKINRKALLAPDKDSVHTGADFTVATNEVEQQLVDIWCDVLRLKKIGIHENFFELGGDSILSIQIIARANQYDIHLTPRLVFKYPTIAELAAAAGKESIKFIEQGVVSGFVELMPIQQWFFEQNISNEQHWNQAYLLELPADINNKLLEKSLQFLLSHHDALRLSFSKKNNIWLQYNEASVNLAFERIDLTSVDKEQQSKCIYEKCTELQKNLNLESAKVMQTALFDLGDNTSKRLLIAIHHLVIDGVSWRILQEDLTTVYRQLENKKNPLLSKKTLSFKEWAEKQKKYAQSNSLKSELDFWSNLPKTLEPFPIDSENHTKNTRESEGVISVTLTENETNSLLKNVPSVYNTKINDVLLTALVQAFNNWTGHSDLTLNIEGHGREEIGESLDLSRTIGWFTALYPLKLHIEPELSLAKSLMSVKEQLRCIPNQGIGFGVLRYLSNEETKSILKNIAEPQVLFNYLGQFDQMFDGNNLINLASESSGASCDPKGLRKHLLEINALIIDGKLKIDWAYSHNIYEKQTIEFIANDYIKYLREIIIHCQSPQAGGITLSDFPLAKLDEIKFNHLISYATSDIKNIENIYPLSPMQSGMLYHSLLEPESGFYFEQYQCTFKENLEREHFEQAWEMILDRHSTLRTAFFWDGLDNNMQIVFRHCELPFYYHDMRSYTDSEKELKIKSFVFNDSVDYFELDKPPLFRINLIQLDNEEYRFIWSYHHLLLDGWSIPLLLTELFEIYTKLTKNEAISLPQARPYHNYIDWLISQNKDKEQEYWMRVLAGYEVPASLSSIEKDNILNKECFEEKQYVISENISAKLQMWSKKHRITLNTLFQGVWGMILSRYSGQKDVVFGTTVSGRPPEMYDVEHMVGLFINTLPVRILVDDEALCLAWFKSLQDQLLEMREYEYSSLVNIHSWSDIPHTLPLFESLFVFENYPAEEDLGSALNMQDVHLAEKTNFPLNLMVQPDKEIILDFIYDANRFDNTKIDAMEKHIQVILESIVSTPDQVISSIPILTNNEKKLFSQWNATEKDYPELCIHQLFLKQVKLTPNKTAVVFNEEKLTFSELDKKSNKLAHYLISLNVKVNDLVGLCVERSLEMIVAILAINKAGAAYLPLDPEYPKERIDFILSDANVNLLVTESILKEDLSEINSELLFLDNVQININDLIDTMPDTSITPNDVAYVIYTSGSTGKPKGVKVPHKSVANFLTTMAVEPGINEDDVLLAVTTLSFDIAVLEIFLPLITGARLELADRMTASDGASILKRIDASGVTIMQATPVTWRLMLAEGWKKKAKFKVLCGGEAMPNELADELVLHASSVWNMYGPTETTVWSTVYQVQELGEKVLIGKPIANTKIHVLDQNMHQQPIGVDGEMYISGSGVTLGYLNQLELTQERFIKKTIDDGLETIFYRTGDLVRYRADGNIEYINRLDNQVKIRGFRIELGEIETVIKEHANVEQSVVVIREDEPGDRRLVAYYVNNGNESISVTSLRKFLRSMLPDYMIPQHFLEIDKIPITPNGKIDRLALPAPFGLSVVDDYVAPRSENEKILASIWKDVLNIDKVGVNDNFFEVGGHSLLSIQVIARFKDKTGIKMELRPMVMDTLEQIAAQFPYMSVADHHHSVEKTSTIISRLIRLIKSAFFSPKQ